MFGLMDAVKTGAAALATAVVVYPIGHWRGETSGAEAFRTGARR